MSICWDARLIWNSQAFFAPDKLFLYFEFENILKRVNIVLFEHLSCILKNRCILNFFSSFSWFKKKVLLRSSKFFLISSQKGVLFPHNFLERDQILHVRTHMCTQFSYKSHHWGSYQEWLEQCEWTHYRQLYNDNDNILLDYIFTSNIIYSLCDKSNY